MRRFAVPALLALALAACQSENDRTHADFLRRNCPDLDSWQACDERLQKEAADKTLALASAVAAAPVTAAPGCDAEALWFDGGARDASAFDAVLRAWSSECRREALRSECAPSCDEVISDRIIEASATPEEKKEALRTRMDLNVAALSNARGLLRRAREIQQYALSIRGTPRSLDPVCMERLRSDFARIDELIADAKSLPIPLGGTSIREFAGSAKGCVSCGDDLTSNCNEMAEPLKDMSDNLAEADKLVAHDKKALATK